MKFDHNWLDSGISFAQSIKSHCQSKQTKLTKMCWETVITFEHYGFGHHFVFEASCDRRNSRDFTQLNMTDTDDMLMVSEVMDAANASVQATLSNQDLPAKIW